MNSTQIVSQKVLAFKPPNVQTNISVKLQEVTTHTFSKLLFAGANCSTQSSLEKTAWLTYTETVPQDHLL